MGLSLATSASPLEQFVLFCDKFYTLWCIQLIFCCSPPPNLPRVSTYFPRLAISGILWLLEQVRVGHVGREATVSFHDSAWQAL